MCENCHQEPKLEGYDCCRECETMYQLMEYHGTAN